MKYKITISFEDAVTAKDVDEAWQKACWMLPNDWSDFMTVEPCDNETYKEYTRER